MPQSLSAGMARAMLGPSVLFLAPVHALRRITARGQPKIETPEIKPLISLHQLIEDVIGDMT